MADDANQSENQSENQSAGLDWGFLDAITSEADQEAAQQGDTGEPADVDSKPVPPTGEQDGSAGDAGSSGAGSGSRDSPTAADSGGDRSEQDDGAAAQADEGDGGSQEPVGLATLADVFGTTGADDGATGADDGATDASASPRAEPQPAAASRSRDRARGGRRLTTTLNVADLNAAIAGASDDRKREAKGERVIVGKRRMTAILAAQQAAAAVAAMEAGEVAAQASSSSSDSDDGDEEPPHTCCGRLRAASQARLQRYQAWVATSDHDTKWLRTKAVGVGGLMMAEPATDTLLIVTLLMVGHTGWAALAIAIRALGALVAGWVGEVAGEEPSADCPCTNWRREDQEERKLCWCCLGMCHLGYSGMLATVWRAEHLRDMVPPYRAMLMLKVYHGLWTSLPIMLLTTYLLSQIATLPRVNDDFSGLQVFVVVLSWLVAMSSTAVAVAVQRVDGSAVDTGPMFRRLEVPFSRLTVHAVSAAHTVLRVLLVFWFSAAYRGFMLLGIMAEGIVKLMFSMWYCPIQRSPTDRTAAAASLLMVWTPMNLVAPYSLPQRFRQRFPVTLVLIHMFTDFALLVMPTLPWLHPGDATAMSGAAATVHGLCFVDECQSTQTTVLTSCCDTKLAVWPFVMLVFLYIPVHLLSLRVLQLDGQAKWFEAKLRRCHKSTRRRCVRWGKWWYRNVFSKTKCCRKCCRGMAKCSRACCKCCSSTPRDGSDAASHAGGGGGDATPTVSWADGLAAAMGDDVTEGEKTMTKRQRRRSQARRRSRAGPSFVPPLGLNGTGALGVDRDTKPSSTDDGDGAGAGDGDGDGAGAGDGVPRRAVSFRLPGEDQTAPASPAGSVPAPVSAPASVASEVVGEGYSDDDSTSSSDEFSLGGPTRSERMMQAAMGVLAGSDRPPQPSFDAADDSSYDSAADMAV